MTDDPQSHRIAKERMIELVEAEVALNAAQARLDRARAAWTPAMAQAYWGDDGGRHTDDTPWLSSAASPSEP